MSKDPAFLFYSSDFLSGVSDLTMEERGQYITLLCVQHQKGELTEKTIRLSVGNASVDVMAHFELQENGSYVNIRLREEAEKRARFAQSRRANGKKGGRPKKKATDNHVDNHVDTHMEDENKDDIVFIKNVYRHLNNEQNLINIIRAQKNYGHAVDLVEMRALLREYCDKILAESDTGKSMAEYKRHFPNWTRTELDRRKQTNGSGGPVQN
jgi:uncharacterized protein YdaU (DUF1376 family)